MSDQKLDLILQELQIIKQDQQDMKRVFTEKFDTLERKVDGIHEQVAQNVESIQAIQSDIDQLKNIQERQEKTIDLLARRSIDQEAELKRIK